VQRPCLGANTDDSETTAAHRPGFAVGRGLLALYLLSLISLSGYRITRARHAEILAELDRRHQAG